MRRILLPSGPLSVNTYLIGADDTNECAVIDPGDATPILELLQSEGLCCTHILITHGHFDHIAGAAALKRATGAKLCIHSDDANKLNSDRESLAAMVGWQLEKTQSDILLHDGDVIHAAGLQMRVLHTPGHCAGSVCYVVDRENAIFCGDVLFRGGSGRTDFPGCSERTLYRSIADQLYSLTGDYAVYCGHGDPTTLDEERAGNPLTCYGASMGW